jgi:hypothetical protein
MHPHAFVDHYCERVAPGLWGEPLNTLSNLGFIVAAWAIYRVARRRSPVPSAVRTLVGLCLAVAAGSASFHLTAQVWSRALDIGLIVLFELAFFWWYLRGAAGLPALAAAGALALFGTMVAYSLQFQQVLHGSVQYVPALAAIAALGAFHHTRRDGSAGLLAAAGIFGVALLLRTLDEPLCDVWPYGTHFVWHLLNAVVMYLCMRALLQTNLTGEPGPHM